MDKSSIRVSVIICVYTEERLADIKEAVNSVLNQSLAPCEVIISVDHNAHLADRLKTELPSQVKIVRNESIQGLSETRNVGIRAACGDIIAFLDDDAVAEKDWLLYLTAPFENINVVAVGGKAVPLWLNGGRPTWFPEELDWIVGCTYRGLPVKENQIRNVPGCNMAFRKSIFDNVGFFRSDMGGINDTPRGGEEAELCLKIVHVNPGYQIYYQLTAQIHHRVTRRRLTLKYLWHRAYNEGFYKTKVQRLSRGPSGLSLSTENSYLRYLLFNSIPGRLRRFYKKGNLAQIGAILVCIIATASGYTVGNLKAIGKRT
jgi:glycosyltransferase involved in cell wall biosynthesis